MRRRREASFGKRDATRVLPLSSWLKRSMALVVRMRRWWASGREKTVKPWGMFCRIQAESFGANLA